MLKTQDQNFLLQEIYIAKISELLNFNKETLCVAESCTGGLISHNLSNQPGASQFFLGSVVSYTWFVKTELLKIPNSVLEEKGDVHPKVANLMARGVKSLLKADWSLSITGSMVPSNHRAETGQVYTAIINPSSEIEIFSKKVTGASRKEMKDQASIFCLENLFKKIRTQNQKEVL